MLRRTLPRTSNYKPANYPELLGELLTFGVRTRAQLRRLMLRHRRDVIAIDKQPLNAINERIYRNDLGEKAYFDLTRRNIRFSWEAMTRLALELEFGAAYEEFSSKRDRVEI